MNKCPHCQSPPVGWLGVSISELPSQRHPFECRKCGGKSLLPKRQSWLLMLLTWAAAMGTVMLMEEITKRLKLDKAFQGGALLLAALAVGGIFPTPLFRLFFKLEPIAEGVWMTRYIRYRRLSWLLSAVSVIWAFPSIIIGRMLWTGQISRHDTWSIGAWIVVGLGLLLIPLTAFCWFVEKPTEKPKEVFVPRESAKFPPADAKPPGER